MGQKVNPVGLRIGITHTWNSRWFSENKRQYAKMVNMDREIRKYLEAKLKDAGIASIVIERSDKVINISIYTSRPGVIIGRQGTAIEDLKMDLFKTFNERFEVAIKEVKKPELEAKLVAENVAMQLERRIAFRRAAKMAVQKTMEAGAKGIKVLVSGRLGGAEIARSEFFAEGKIPLHTFRADISYHHTTAQTTYGGIGVKVWIYRGQVFNKKRKNAAHNEESA